MNPFRPAIALPLVASLGLHAVMGWSVARHWSASSSQNAEPIQISYAVPAQNAPLSVPKKKIRGIPVPRQAASEETAPVPAPSDFEKNMQTRLKQQQKLLTKLSKPPASARPKSSAEILSDPKKGKIFVEYFTEVRHKIQETLSERYARRYPGHGGVALGFVLDSKGFLEKVAVLTKGTDGDARLQELAVQCLRESAPFGAFPPELGSERIAFNVTLFFVDR
jgi:hypothetical protein